MVYVSGNSVHCTVMEGTLMITRGGGGYCNDNEGSLL